MKCAAIGVLMMLFCHGVGAKSLGVLGQTYPVAEKSLLTLIYERLNALQGQGELHNLEQSWVKQVSSHVIRPKPLHLLRTDKTRQHSYTPVAKAPHDILNALGHIIIKKGTEVNALDSLPRYQPVWVFIDFDDPAQRLFAQWIRPKYQDIQWILTGGNVRDAEQGINETIYFDQEGRITSKLDIKHVPAVVTRKGRALNIMEIAIKEDGHAL